MTPVEKSEGESAGGGRGSYVVTSALSVLGFASDIVTFP